MKIGVLFVCLGNICRSPMAEAVFRHMVKERGLSDWFVIDSAGLGGWHVGSPPHEGTRKKLRENNIDASGLVARQIRREDLDNFDYIIVMDEENLQGIQRLARNISTYRASIHRLMDFAPETGTTEVPDPYYNGRFAEVFELVQAGCRGLLDMLIQKHDLKPHSFK